MEEHNKRELAKKQAASAGKGAHAVASSFMKNSFDAPRLGYFKEGPMLKALCKRLAGRSTVVGSTVFTFNDEGVCSVIDQANAKVDFETLLAQNGVSLHSETAAPAPVVEQPKMKAAPPPSVSKFEEEENEEEEDDTKEVKSEKSDSKKKSGKK